MSRLIKSLLAFSFLLMVTGCEGYRSAYGKVIDNVSKQPLDSVYCFCVTAERGMYTDSSGYYQLQNYMGSCMPHCRDIVVRFSKTGYKLLELVNPVDSLVFLEKQ